MSPIVAHPDVRRMLMTMRALTTAARALCYACAFATDMANAHRAAAGGALAGSTDGAKWQARADLLTPVAKAFPTDIGFEVASLGVQVHGGMGFIEETGAAQTLRDSRIASIYEGTNGIQAIDLVTRKLPLSDGTAVRDLISELRDVAERSRAENRPDFGAMGHRLTAALDDLTGATEHLLQLTRAGKHVEALAGATPYLRLFGLAAGGAYLAKGALASDADSSPGAALRIAAARFFAEQLAPETAGLKMAVVEGADAVLGIDPALLAGS